METKHYIALIVLIAVGCGGALLATISQRVREFFFLIVVSCGVLAEAGALDVNFFGQYWYRGTSRGLGISVIDIIAWCVLIGSLVAPRYHRRPWFLPAGMMLYVAYFIYCGLSVMNAWQPAFALWELVNIPRAILVMLMGAAFVRSKRELGLIVIGLGIAVCVQVTYAVEQRVIKGMFRPPGTLDHANSLSMYLCLVTPMLIAAMLADFNKYIRWWAGLCAGLAAFGVLLTLSRAGIPIFAAVCFGTVFMCVSWTITRKKIVIASLVVAVVSGALVKSWDQLVARFGSATFSEEVFATDGENRGVYWRWARMIVDDDPFGVGLNNWSYAVSKEYGERLGFNYQNYDDIKNAPEKADLPSIVYSPPAHALVALTLGELGIPGIVLFGLVWLRWFHMGLGFLKDRLERMPMHRMGIGILFSTVGLFLQSTTEWTYRQPAMFLTFHLMLGALASLHYARRKAPAKKKVQRRIPVPLEELEMVPMATARSATPAR